MIKLFAKSLLMTLRWFLIFYVAQLIVVFFVGFIRLDRQLPFSTIAGSLPAYKAIDGSDLALAMLVSTITALWDAVRSKHELLSKLIMRNTQSTDVGATTERYLGVGYLTLITVLFLVALLFFARFSNHFHSKTDTEANVSSEIKTLIRDARRNLRQDPPNVYNAIDKTVSEGIINLKRKVLYYLDDQSPWMSRNTLQITLISIVFIFCSKAWCEFMAISSESEDALIGTLRRNSSILVFLIPAIILGIFWWVVWPQDKPNIQFLITTPPASSKTSTKVQLISDADRKASVISHTAIYAHPSFPLTYTVDITFIPIVSQSQFLERAVVEEEIRDQLGLPDITRPKLIRCSTVISNDPNKKEVDIEWTEDTVEGEIYEDTNVGAKKRIGYFTAIVDARCPNVDTGGT